MFKDSSKNQSVTSTNNYNTDTKSSAEKSAKSRGVTIFFQNRDSGLWLSRIMKIAMPGCPVELLGLSSPFHDGAKSISGQMAFVDTNAGLDQSLSLLNDISLSRMTVHCVAFHNRPDPEVMTRALQAGARAFLVMSEKRSTLIRQIQGISLGEICLPASLADHAIHQFRTTSKTENADKAMEKVEVLSQRELLVLQLIVNGATASAVANKLGLKVSTVQTYIRRIYEKLGVSSRAEAASKAVQLDLHQAMLETA